jgi:hypothetical protein
MRAASDLPWFSDARQAQASAGEVEHQLTPRPQPHLVTEPNQRLSRHGSRCGSARNRSGFVPRLGLAERFLLERGPDRGVCFSHDADCLAQKLAEKVAPIKSSAHWHPA